MQSPPIKVPPHQLIAALQKRMGKLEARQNDVETAIKNEAALNRKLWLKLRQGFGHATALVEKVHKRGERS